MADADLLAVLKQTEKDLERLGEIDAALGKVATEFERLKAQIAGLRARLRENDEHRTT